MFFAHICCDLKMMFDVYVLQLSKNRNYASLAPMFLRRRFDANVLTPTFLALIRFCADIFSCRRFGTNTFLSQNRFGAETVWRRMFWRLTF